MFLLFDEDGFGDVFKKEFKEFGVVVGVKLMDKDLWSFMIVFDEDGFGFVDLEFRIVILLIMFTKCWFYLLLLILNVLLVYVLGGLRGCPCLV